MNVLKPLVSDSAVPGFIRKIAPGQQVRCDLAYYTEEGVFVRIGGVWTRLGPSADEPDVVVGDLHYNLESYKVWWKDQPIYFTNKEFKLLTYLARRPGVVRRRQEILDWTHGVGSSTESRIVDVVIRKVRKKFKSVDPDFDHVVSHYCVGYSWKA
jgi:DNA-binding response OmpR family regulator